MTFTEKRTAKKVINLIKAGNYNTNRPSNIIIPELCQTILFLTIELDKTKNRVAILEAILT